MKIRFFSIITLSILFPVITANAQKVSFFDLVETGTAAEVQAAIKAGAKVNLADDFGWTPLMIAAKSNPNPDVMTVLVKAGASLKVVDVETGATALHRCAKYNTNPAVIEALIKAGADLKALDQANKTVLMYAAQYNKNPAVVEALLKAGANIKLKDTKGKTAYDYAAANDKLKDTETYKKLVVK